MDGVQSCDKFPLWDGGYRSADEAEDNEDFQQQSSSDDEYYDEQEESEQEDVD